MLLSVPAMLSKEPPPNTLARKEDILDKSHYGSLIGHGGIDVILLCPGRDNQQRKARSVTTPPLRVQVPTATPGKAFASLAVEVPQVPAPFSESSAVAEPFTMFMT